MKVEVAILGSQSLMVSVDVKATSEEEEAGAVIELRPLGNGVVFEENPSGHRGLQSYHQSDLVRPSRLHLHMARHRHQRGATLLVSDGDTAADDV